MVYAGVCTRLFACSNWWVGSVLHELLPVQSFKYPTQATIQVRHLQIWYQRALNASYHEQSDIQWTVHTCKVASFSRRPGGGQPPCRIWSDLSRVLVLLKKVASPCPVRNWREKRVWFVCHVALCKRVISCWAGRANLAHLNEAWPYLAKQGEEKVVLNPNMPIIFCFFLPFYYLSKMPRRFLNLRGGII